MHRLSGEHESTTVTTHPADATDSRLMERPPVRLNRRDLLLGATALVGLAGAGKAIWDDAEHFHRAPVVIAKAMAYDATLVDVIERGLTELGVVRDSVRRKSVLLKPNLVEPAAEEMHQRPVPAILGMFRLDRDRPVDIRQRVLGTAERKQRRAACMAGKSFVTGAAVRRRLACSGEKSAPLDSAAKFCPIK